MKRAKKIIALTLVAVMVLGLAACGGGSSAPAAEGGSDAPAEEVKNISLKLSHYRADGAPADLDAEAFAANVAAADPSVEVVIYPAAQLGDYTTVQELVSVGDVEMQLATLSSTVDKFLGITSAPYICSTWEEAKAIFHRDSEFSAVIAEHLADQNITMLAVYPLYFGGVILNKEPKDPANLEYNEGIKIRCQTMKGAELVSSMLGYLPTPMALSDCFTSLQTGVIDGMIGSGAEGYYSGYRDVATYYLPYNDHFEVWYLYINTDTFNSLNESQQKALVEAAHKLEDDRWAIAPTETEEYEKKLVEYGIEMIDFTDEELNAFYEKCQETVWPQLTELYGEWAVELVASLKG